MTIAHFEPFSGISGDMTLGAMVDAGLDMDLLRSELSRLKLDGYTLEAARVKRCGMQATKVTVRLAEAAHTSHRHYPHIVEMIEGSGLPAGVMKTAVDIFTTLGEAEARVHGTALEKVHFHEVGAVDSIVDIVGAAIGFEALGIEEVTCSPVNTGHGSVKTEHGVLPVPAPATALILEGIPTYVEGPAVELATPTGAAIIRTMAKGFGPRPAMAYSKVAAGAGGHDFKERPNILRLFLAERSADLKTEQLTELAANIDDMNPQAYPLVMGKLFAAGALDVTVTPMMMKKGRPAFELKVLCNGDRREVLEEILFRHTTTLGVRRYEVKRVALPREIRKVSTQYGEVDVKVATLSDGSLKAAPEFGPVKVAAEKSGATFETVYQAALDAVGI